MADRRQIGVRYCGGCNPRYDRVALVKRIGGFFPEAEFVTAQAAAILMMTTERYAGKLPLFMGVREATFRRKILPGDTLEIHVSLLEEKTERAIAACRGQVFVEGVLAADLELRLAFR